MYLIETIDGSFEEASIAHAHKVAKNVSMFRGVAKIVDGAQRPCAYYRNGKIVMTRAGEQSVEAELDSAQKGA